jgi:hypothetical protein
MAGSERKGESQKRGESKKATEPKMDPNAAVSDKS